MALEKLHLKHLLKGWQLRREQEKSGEIYRTKADAVAAAEKLAKSSKRGLIILVEPRSRRRHITHAKTAMVFSAYGLEERVPRTRYAKRNPAKLETVTLARMPPAEKAQRFRTWAASHSGSISIPPTAFDRESFYEGHD